MTELFEKSIRVLELPQLLERLSQIMRLVQSLYLAMGEY